MRAKTMETARTGMKIGAVLGGVAFLAVGIVPGFHYGGYAALMLLTKIAGHPLAFGIGTRVLMVLGILLGILCMGSVSIVLGAVFGTLGGFAVQALSSLRGEMPAEHRAGGRIR